MLAAVLRADVGLGGPAGRNAAPRCAASPALPRPRRRRRGFRDIADARLEMDEAFEPAILPSTDAPRTRSAAWGIARRPARHRCRGGVVAGPATPAGRGGGTPDELRGDPVGGGADPLRRHAGPGPVAGRNAARLRLGPRRTAAALRALRAIGSSRDRSRAPRAHRLRFFPPTDSGRFLRGRQGEEGPGGRRCRDGRCRRPEQPRRRLARRRLDRLRRITRRA